MRIIVQLSTGRLNSPNKTRTVSALKYPAQNSSRTYSECGNLIRTTNFYIYINSLAGQDPGPRRHLSCSGRRLILVEGYTKRDTKSGTMVIQLMNEKVREVLLLQRELLNNSSAELQGSSLVFPASDGGLCRLDSLKKRFSQLRDLSGIPKEFRPNYCLRDKLPQ